MLQAASDRAFGQAMVGDTRQGDLCRARVWIADGLITEATLDVVSDEPMDPAINVFLTYLKGRSYDEVLHAVTARSCSSDGCSSVEGKCFNLLQEAVYRALGDWASRHVDIHNVVLSTPGGGVDLLHRKVPISVHETADLSDVANWARSRILAPEE